MWLSRRSRGYTITEQTVYLRTAFADRYADEGMHIYGLWQKVDEILGRGYAVEMQIIPKNHYRHHTDTTEETINTGILPACHMLYYFFFLP